MNHLCSTDVLETRQHISDEIRRIVNLVAFESGIAPVGTFRYNIFKYPGDIDVFEELEGCCELSTAKLSAAQKIQSIVRNIKQDSILFVEFKAGYDLRFKLYTGTVNSHIEDYNPGLIRRDITNLYEAGLLSECEWNKLLCHVKDDPTIEDIATLNEALRRYWVLRWSEDEVLQGYKILPGNYKLFLDVALSQGTIVKLDIIAHIEGRFVEVSNFFLVSVLDKLGKKILISQELSDYEQSLVLDVYKYYPKNPLKSIKRLWMYLAFNQRLCDMAAFTPLFESNIALYSQILSDIETALRLMSSELYPRLVTIYGGHTLLFESLRHRLELLGSVCNADDVNLTVENLAQLQICLQEYINQQIYEWLAQHNIDIFALIRLESVSQTAMLASQAAGNS